MPDAMSVVQVVVVPSLRLDGVTVVKLFMALRRIGNPANRPIPFQYHRTARLVAI